MKVCSEVVKPCPLAEFGCPETRKVDMLPLLNIRFAPVGMCHCQMSIALNGK